MTQARAAQHLATLTEVFDFTKHYVKSPFPFASDLTDLARPIAIDGSRDMIARGDHREAVFWLAVTYSRCQQVLLADAPPALHDRFGDGYRRLLADLGIATHADLLRRAKRVEQFLPELWRLTRRSWRRIGQSRTNHRLFGGEIAPVSGVDYARARRSSANPAASTPPAMATLRRSAPFSRHSSASSSGCSARLASEAR